MLMTGAALGAGSAIGHEAVRGIMGSGSHGAQQAAQPGYAPDQQQQMQMQQQPQYAPADYAQGQQMTQE